MSITQQSMDINEDYHHCAFRSRARPGFTCLEGSGKRNVSYLTCLEGSGRLNMSYYGKHASSVIGVGSSSSQEPRVRKVWGGGKSGLKEAPKIFYVQGRSAPKNGALAFVKPPFPNKKVLWPP